MNNTRLLVLASFAVCVITLIPNRREKFTEWFDHGKPSREVVLAADEINLNNYDEFEPKITHDVMDRIVRATNFAVQQRLRVPTYVIETTAVKAYRHRENNETMYEIQFMLVKQTGYAHGFSVTAMVESKSDESVEVVSLRTQPIDVNSPADTAVYESSGGREFVDYTIVRDTVQLDVDAVLNRAQKNSTAQ